MKLREAITIMESFAETTVGGTDKWPLWNERHQEALTTILNFLNLVVFGEWLKNK